MAENFYKWMKGTKPPNRLRKRDAEGDSGGMGDPFADLKDFFSQRMNTFFKDQQNLLQEFMFKNQSKTSPKKAPESDEGKKNETKTEDD